MRSRHILAFAAMGLGYFAVTSGCSSDVDETGGGGSGTGTGTGTGTTTTITTTTGTGGGTGSGTPSGTGTGDGNDSFEEAVEVTVDGTEWTVGEISPIDSDKDYFSFTGTAGTPYLLLSDSKPDSDEHDPSYPDLLMTVYDSDHNQIAQNDDPPSWYTQDSELYLFLPEDGTYYITIEEFCASEGAGSYCDQAYFDDISNFDYGVVVLTLDGADNGSVPEAEPNDATTDATLMEYETTGTAGSYYMTLAWGTFSDTSDVDYYEINLPDDLDLGDNTPYLQAEVYPGGVDGNGSTAEVGTITLYAADGTTKIAETDASTGGQLTPPMTLTDTYFLAIRHVGGAAGAHDFYFLNHRGTAYDNQVEVESNDTVGTANVLTPQTNTDGSRSHFFMGTLTPGTDDADNFRMSALADGEFVSVVCGAWRNGSGLRGFQFKLIDADTSTDLSSSLSGAETATEDLRIQDIDPGTSENIVVQVSATSQAVDVTSNHYLCNAIAAYPD